jgi:hypothetical protein
MKVSNSHASYPQDSLIAPSYFEQRAPVHQAAGEQLLATPIQTAAFHVTEPAATAETKAATPASKRTIGTDLRARTSPATDLIADTG